MVVVALYFWGPLVWKFIATSRANSDSKANMAALILTDDPIEPGQQNHTRRGPKFRWEKVRQLISQDPRMTSAAFEVAWIDPFAKPTTSAETSPEGETGNGEPTANGGKAAAVLDARNLNVVLGGIMSGPRGRVATINGESYRAGDQISLVDKHDKSVNYRFRIVKITRTGVELEGAGTTITLELVPPKLANGDDIERGKAKD